MRKALHDEVNHALRQEYDLSQLLLRGVRGKYAKPIRAEGAVTPEADECAKEFPGEVLAGAGR